MLRIQTAAVPPSIHSSRTTHDPSADHLSARITPASLQASDPHPSSSRVDPAWGLMNGIVGTAPPGAMYVRALYDYEADDRTSLSFHEGDVIQVITQLESGWWDGVINGVRGWFPSNYCQTITSPDDLPDPGQNGLVAQVDDDPEDPEIYDDNYDLDDDSEADGPTALPIEGTDGGDKSRADFWIPQATPDGRLFYYNMMTGDHSMELPLESPISANETGPRDRMNVNIPDKTRPPPEMMARGLTQDEDDESLTSASEAEGDSSRLATRRSKVSQTSAPPSRPNLPDLVANYAYSSPGTALPSVVPYHRRHRWILLMALLQSAAQGTTSRPTEIIWSLARCQTLLQLPPSLVPPITSRPQPLSREASLMMDPHPLLAGACSSPT